MDTIATYLKFINKNYEDAQKGHFRTNMTVMRTNVLGILRELEHDLGIKEGDKKGDVGLPTPSINQMVVCKYCDWQTDKGEYSMKSHLGRKHKNIRK